MEARVRSGIHPNVRLSAFPIEEQEIIQKISREWYVTNGGEEIALGSSRYRYILIKPTSIYQEMFNLEREIVAVFNNYDNFQPRTLDSLDVIMKRYQSLRLEKICSVIISKDKATGAKLRDFLRSDQEAQILVPFSYEELINKYDDYFLRNRFKDYFYTRDLFAFQSPLRKDIFFFGRTDLIHSIVNRHKSGENAGLFGLRKTGKTSVVFGIERALGQVESKSVLIDCQTPAFHRRRWNKALYYIISELRSQNKLNAPSSKEEMYTEENAPILFERELFKIYKEVNKKRILIIFDEIENITFSISPTEHWAKELDFVYFWQTLRSLFQKSDIFSYLVVGTNPMCVETPTIHGKDNPIFNQIPPEYIPSFDWQQTRDMVRKLGRLMGIKFDDSIYGKLAEDFGGHPFLIRHICSIINSICSTERPAFVDKSLYEEAKQIFGQRYHSYVEMILIVLKEFYSDEYAMLEYLAQEDMATFHEFTSLSPYYTNHLLGYGIIEKHRDRYNFKIESVKAYLAIKQRYKKTELTPEQKLQEISERRNALEPKLRLIIRNQLRASLGKAGAKEAVLNILGEPRKTELGKLSYEDIFDSNISQIYFDDLRKIITKYWDQFRNIFSKDKQTFDRNMLFINQLRADAHAKKVSKEDMDYFRVCITTIENEVKDFLD